ncbi:PRTRC system protein E [Cupriavidus basilensis]
MFKALHQFAQASPLILTIVAEDDQLRVTLTPRLDASSTVKAAPRPLSIVATPEELDADFATAIGIFAPGALSVLEQAEVVAKVNSGKDTGKAPAASTEKATKPAASAGQGRGRRAGKTPDLPPSPGSDDQTDPEDEGKDVKTLPLPLAEGEQQDAAPPAPTPTPAPPSSSEGEKTDMPVQTDDLGMAI